MSLVITDPATRAPVIHDRAATDQPDHDREHKPSTIWILLESLAHAGALVDPTGVLAAQRLRMRSPDCGIVH
jgi:hypothetical protein